MEQLGRPKEKMKEMEKKGIRKLAGLQRKRRIQPKEGEKEREKQESAGGRVGLGLGCLWPST